MGHYCRICGRSRANERFSGRGHRNHICKDCRSIPFDKRDRIERLDELHNFLRQSLISEKNTRRLNVLVAHEDSEVAGLAGLILEIARLQPGKRNRWLKLARCHRSLFERAVAFLGPEYFRDLLAGYGDFGNPLWEKLDRFEEDQRQG